MRISRNTRKLWCSLAVLTVLTVLTVPAISAPPDGKGGGNNNNDGSDTSLPPVRYQVDFISVPGLSLIWGINDYGQALASIDVAFANQNVSTIYTHTPVVIEPDGTVTYIENSLNTTVDWDFQSLRTINNGGEILCTGVRFLSDGTFVRSALLLMPDEAGKYDVLELTPHNEAFIMNDLGDLVVFDDQDPVSGLNPFTMLNADGTSTDLSNLALIPNDRSTMNNLGQFLGLLQDGSDVRIEPNGSVTDFEILLDANLSSGFRGLVSDINDRSFSAGSQQILIKKGKNKRREARPVVYDNQGQAQWLDAPPAYDLRINDQLTDGESVIAGYTVDWSVYYPGEADKSTDLTKDLWIKFPGYPGAYVVELMDAPNQDRWAALEYHDYNYGSAYDFELLTPRFPDGSVDHNTPPTLMGFIYNPSGTGSFGLGIFVLTPVPEL